MNTLKIKKSKNILDIKAKSLDNNDLKKSHKFNSLTDASFSNPKNLKKYISKRIQSKYDDKDYIDITIVTHNSKLYQGTDFNFKNFNDLKTMIKYYFLYYDSRHRGAYFLGTDKTASKYGKNLDFSNIVYTTIPDHSDIEKQNSLFDDIYALYYVDARGSNIKYKLNDTLNLINLSDLNTIKKLWNLLDESDLTEKEKDLSKKILILTCAKGENHQKEPKKINRISFYETDDKLIDIFKYFFKPYILQKYNFKIDGWIYYRSDDINKFHSEILVLNKEKLSIENIKTYMPIFFKNIPSREEFLRFMKDRRVDNDGDIPNNVILSNTGEVIPL